MAFLGWRGEYESQNQKWTNWDNDFTKKSTKALISAALSILWKWPKKMLFDGYCEQTSDISEVCKEFEIKDATINSAYVWGKV